MVKLPENWMEQWREATRHLSYRAESLENASNTFAETTFVQMLMVNRNQVVFGRRGTGKTHLLMRVYEEYVSNFDTYKTIPISLNGSALRQSAISVVDNPELKGLSLYVDLVARLADQLHGFINDKLDASVWDRLVGGERSVKAKRAKKLASDLAALIQAGEVRVMPAGEVSDETKSLQEASAEVSAGVGVNLSDPKKIGWELKAGAKAGSKKLKTDLRTKKLKGRVILPFSEVSRSLEELLGILQDASLVLLIDEWSDVDLDIATQPYLADMLKRTLASVRGMHVKLACIPMRTHLATRVTKAAPIPLGYEVGNDIFTDIDLDEAGYTENDLSRICPFYFALLQKHIGIRFKPESQMQPKDFESFLFENIFEDVEVFSELCQAAACVPREFLQLFQNASAMQEDARRRKLGMREIRVASKRNYNEKKQKVRIDSPEMKIHDGIYASIVVPFNTYLFLVRERHVVDPRIQILWTEKLIHRLPYDYEDPKTLETCVYFLMDHGRCVSITEQQAAEKGRKKGRELAAGVASRFEGNDIWSRLIKSAADFGLPMLAELSEKRRALLHTPAGNLTPDPAKIIVATSVFDENDET